MLQTDAHDWLTLISKQSGVSEVIKYAVKLDFWDTDAIADAIYGIFNYPALSGYIKATSLMEVENLRWTKAASKVKEIYYQIAYSRAG